MKAVTPVLEQCFNLIFCSSLYFHHKPRKQISQLIDLCFKDKDVEKVTKAVITFCIEHLTSTYYLQLYYNNFIKNYQERKK